MAEVTGLTPEKISAIQALIKDNPDLAKALNFEAEIIEEEAKETDLTKQFAELKAQIAELSKPDAVDTKLANLDPAENGDPSWGYGTIKERGMTGLGVFAKELSQHAIHGDMSPRLNAIKNATKAAGAGLQENVDSEGGFLIPVEYRNELLQNGIQKSEFMNRATQIPMAVNTVKIPYVKDTTHASGTIHGGIRLYYTAEEGTLQDSKPEFGQITLSLNKLIGLAYSSSEMLEDSPISIGPLLSSMFQDAWAWRMDYDIINGSGAGTPRGILNSAALISQAAEPAQPAATIVAENVINMYSRMPAANKRNALWCINEDVFPQLATMTIDVGTGGVPVYLPANSLAGQPHDTLMGKPLIQTEHCQTKGTVGDIIFWDPSQVLVGTKAGAGVRQDTSIHLKFDTDESAFRFVWRVDMQCWWASAVTPRHSAVTLSPLVALATRP